MITGDPEQAVDALLARLGKLGTDFDAEEQRIIPALRWLKENASHWRGRAAIAAGLAGAHARPEDARALARMGFEAPRGFRERLLRRLLALSLQRTGSSG